MAFGSHIDRRFHIQNHTGSLCKGVTTQSSAGTSKDMAVHSARRESSQTGLVGQSITILSGIRSTLSIITLMNVDTRHAARIGFNDLIHNTMSIGAVLAVYTSIFLDNDVTVLGLSADNSLSPDTGGKQRCCEQK